MASKWHLPEGWRLAELSEVAIITDSLHKTPSYSTSGLPMVRVTDIKPGVLDFSKTFKVADEVFAEFTRNAKPQQGDVIISRVGSYGIASYVNDNTSFCLGQNTALISPRINSRYIYLALQSEFVKAQIDSAAVGSTQKTISLKSIRGLKIPIGSEEEIKRIAHILGSLDDKIELNRRQNETLESLARALFQSWFVDFDPVWAKAHGESEDAICRRLGLSPQVLALFPAALEESALGPVPAGWGVSTIGAEVDVAGGGTPSTNNPKFWEGGTYDWATPKDLSGLAEPILLGTERQITEAGLARISSGLLSRGTVLMSSRAPVGYLAINAAGIAINQGFIAMSCSKRLSNYYTLFWCQQNMESIKQRASGTTFLEISKGSFKPMPVLVPPSNLMREFSDSAEAVFLSIEANLKESRTLAALRDELLPQLLSGKLVFPNT